MVTTRPPKTIVKPTALGPVANTDTKLLIYGLFQKGRVLAQDELAHVFEAGGGQVVLALADDQVLCGFSDLRIDYPPSASLPRGRSLVGSITITGCHASPD